MDRAAEVLPLRVGTRLTVALDKPFVGRRAEAVAKAPGR